MGQYHVLWYCGTCGDGPQAEIVVGCPLCGHLRDNCCKTERLGVFEKSNPSPVINRVNVSPQPIAFCNPEVRSIEEERTPNKLGAESELSVIHLVAKKVTSSTSDSVHPVPAKDHTTSPTLEIPHQDTRRRKAELLAQRILDGIHLDLDVDAKIVTCTRKGQANSKRAGQAPGKRQEESSSSTGQSNSNPGSKRRHEGERGEEDDERKDDKKPRRTQDLKPDGRKARLLACPFFKGDRHGYNRESCRKGYPNIWRLKEHIYRAHVGCLTCRKKFREMGDLRVHQEQPCARTPGRPEVIIDGQKVADLKSRKDTGKSTEEYWRWMFRIIFPEAVSVPSPYNDVDDGEDVVFGNAGFDLSSPHSHLALTRAIGNHLGRGIEQLITQDGSSARIGIFESIQSHLSEIISQSVRGGIRDLQIPFSIPDASGTEQGYDGHGVRQQIIGNDFASLDMSPGTWEMSSLGVPNDHTPTYPNLADFGLHMDLSQADYEAWYWALLNTDRPADSAHIPDEVQNSCDGMQVQPTELATQTEDGIRVANASRLETDYETGKMPAPDPLSTSDAHTLFPGFHPPFNEEGE